MVTTRYTAIFQSGKTMTFIESPRFRNRLDIYNYICFNRLGKNMGHLLRSEQTLCRAIKKAQQDTKASFFVHFVY